jgi:hypothetical protein
MEGSRGKRLSMSDIRRRPERERPPLTAEELELLATPGEELRARTEVMSYDAERFEARISVGERWQQLIQAHLYYDHVITQMLIEALVNPDAINASRMSFLQKLQLIRAMGLLNGELASTLEFINGLRNKIAHRLDFDVTGEDETDLTNCTPKYLRDMVSREADRQPGPVLFHELLNIVLQAIEVMRADYVFDRLYSRKLGLRVRVVVSKTTGVIWRE